MAARAHTQQPRLPHRRVPRGLQPARLPDGSDVTARERGLPARLRRHAVAATAAPLPGGPPRGRLHLACRRRCASGAAGARACPDSPRRRSPSPHQLAMAGTAGTQAAEGGLYIAGAGFSFEAAAERALAQNPAGRRAFLLTRCARSLGAAPQHAAGPGRCAAVPIAAQGVLLVCQRDLDKGRIDAAQLVPGVVPVRGWPAKGGCRSTLLPGRDRSRCRRPAGCTFDLF